MEVVGFEPSKLTMAEAVNKGLSLLVAMGNEIPIDVVRVIGGIPEFFELRHEFVMSGMSLLCPLQKYIL